MHKKISLIFDSNNERLDYYLSKKYSDYSRSYFQRLIKSKKVLVNQQCVSPSCKPKFSDNIDVEFTFDDSPLVAQDIPLNIIFEDNDVLIINKPSGLVVHPACGHNQGTLLNALLGYADSKFNPFLVHRLDKDTSGILIIAKNERSKNSLVKQFQNRTIKKTYLAVVKGEIKEEKGIIEAPLGRSSADRKKIVVGPTSKKTAVTEFNVLKRKKGFTVVEVKPITGRTHQIRSHLSFINHPVLGDVTYGGPDKLNDFIFKRQMLHAYKISFTHPSQAKKLSFIAPVPEDLMKVLEGEITL